MPENSSAATKDCNAPYNRWLYLCSAIFSTVLCAGVFYGWNSFQTILESEGFFSSRCPDGPGCKEQTLQFSWVYTAASIACYITPLISGLFSDKFGPRATLRGLFTFFVLGCALLIASAYTHDDAFILPGYIFLGLCSSSAYIPLISVANLFPEYKSAIISFLCAAFDFGSVVFLVMAAMYKSGAAYGSLMIAYIAGPVAICVLMTIFLWPRKPFEAPVYGEPKVEKDLCNLSADKSTLDVPTTTSVSIESLAKEEDTTITIQKEEAVSEGPNPNDPMYKSPFLPKLNLFKLYNSSLLKQFSTTEYILAVIFFTVNVFRFNFYLGNVHSQLNAMGQEDGKYTDIFSAIFPCGILAVFPVSFILNTGGPIVGTFCLWLFGFLLSILALIPNLPLQIFTFIVFVVFRSFLFSVISVFCVSFFGFRNLSTLIGLITTVGGVMAFAQTPIVSWALGEGDPEGDGDFKFPNVLMLCLQSAMVFFPLWLSYRSGHGNVFSGIFCPRGRTNKVASATA